MNDQAFKILDCTLRDGGLTCKACFTIDTARKIFEASCRAGIDYVELGYCNNRTLLPPETADILQFCKQDTINRIVTAAGKHKTRIAVMQDAHKALPEDVIACRDSAVDMIRIATYISDLDKAMTLANNAVSKGYECSINIMAVSTIDEKDISAALDTIGQETDVHIVYMVDSNGALLPAHLDNLFPIFSSHRNNFKIGVHFHNSLQLAFANTLKSITLGADLVDTTLLGIGRGAGNCPTELILDHFRQPRHQVRPLLKTIEECILPLRSRTKWGYHIPYMLAANRNQHPGRAADWLKQSGSSDLLDFFDSIDGE